jgi:hypothetical protein
LRFGFLHLQIHNPGSLGLALRPGAGYTQVRLVPPRVAQGTENLDGLGSYHGTVRFAPAYRLLRGRRKWNLKRV